jgi:hypothetical protein
MECLEELRAMPAPHIEENVLDRYAMGTLPGESIPKVEEHLLDCLFCQSRLVETDEFLMQFRAAATEVEMRPASLWQRIQNAQRLLWGGSAVLAAGLGLLLMPSVPRQMLLQPVTVQMQSLRGPDSRMQIAKGRPGLLVFDVPIAASRTFEVEIVDTSGNEILKGNGIVKEDHLTFPIRRLAAAAYWVRVYQSQPAKVLVAEYGLEAK